MIDIITFRIRVGCFNSGVGSGKGKHSSSKCFENLYHSGRFPLLNLKRFCIEEVTVCSPQQYILPSIIYYIYCYFILFFMLTSSHYIIQGVARKTMAPLFVPQISCGLSLLCISHVKVAYFYLISFVLLTNINR